MREAPACRAVLNVPRLIDYSRYWVTTGWRRASGSALAWPAASAYGCRSRPAAGTHRLPGRFRCVSCLVLRRSLRG